MPPTTNNLFVNVRGRGRVPSKVYAAWRKLVAPILATVPPVLVFPVEVRIEVVAGAGWRRNSDIANREKAVTDAFVDAEIIPDDTCEYVARIVIEYVPEPKIRKWARQPSMVRVKVSPLESMDRLDSG